MPKQKTKQKEKKPTITLLRETARLIANGYYQYQEVRIGTLNRIRNLLRRKIEDKEIGDKETEKPEEEKSKGDKYSDSKLLPLIDALKQDKVLTEREWSGLKEALGLADDAAKTEKKYLKIMERYIEEEPVWVEFLSKVKGIGKVLSINLIKEFGYCENYNYVSSLWKHTGNDVTEKGVAPKLRKGQQPTYSPRLKKMAWKISDCLLKNNFLTIKNEDGTKERIPLFYRRIYDQEKERQLAQKYEPGELSEKYPAYKKEDTQLSKGHAHNRALRKMRKIFLEHYWVASRELMGLEVTKPYHFKYPGADGKVHDTYYKWEDAIKDPVLKKKKG